ncbi:LCP family protein [Miltoncostaea marina]|uniref:LCP family protein n=1 Tax=Miltoncostaea marina TaxID=2843215 RepID=UPI001C3DBD96|nr:LCP family protein [Miltoncostaea marina]
MSRTTKPYRRFRARGHGEGQADGLQALRELNARENGAPGGGGAPPAAPPRRTGEGLPRPRPSRDERRRLRELQRDGRPWWSFRGLGPGGWVARGLALLLLAVLVWGGLGYMALDGAVDEANGKITPSARAALDDAPGGMLGTPQNTLILGVDTRRGQTRSRADTILLMRTDPDAGRIRYLSIPRDYRVDLPGQGAQKINAAFFFYGQAGAIRAVKRLTGLPVHHIIVIKFAGFPTMVDAVGGVTVSNPTALVDCPYEAGRTVSFPAGRIELDGARALEYARARQGDCGGDFGRALRQQAIVAALKSKVLSFTSLPLAPWRGADVVRSLQTDIGTIDMAKMGWLQARLEQRPDDRILLSGEPQMIDGISFVVSTNPDQNEREIARFIARD